MARFHPNIILGLWAVAALLLLLSLLNFLFGREYEHEFPMTVIAVALLIAGVCMAGFNLYGKDHSTEPLETGTVV